MGLSDKAMLVDITFHSWGGYKHDKKVSQEVAEAHNSDVTMGRYNKQLIPREAFAKINRVYGRIDSDYKKLTLPWLDTGSRILSSDAYFKFTEKMRHYSKEWNEAVDAFCEEYPSLMEESERRLNGLFRAEEYPKPNEIKHRFGFNWRIAPLPVAGDFRVGLDENEVALIRQGIEETQKEAVKVALLSVAKRIEAALAHLVERIRAVDNDGGILRESTLDNVKELAELIPELNVMEDARLDEIARRIKSDLGVFGSEHLRSSDKAREFAKKTAEEILAKVAGFAV